MSGETNGHVRPAQSDRPMVKRQRETPGLPPAGQAAPHGGIAQTEFFGQMRIPMQNGTGDPAKAKRKGA